MELEIRALSATVDYSYIVQTKTCRTMEVPYDRD
jgi:hypothetical protein